MGLTLGVEAWPDSWPYAVTSSNFAFNILQTSLGVLAISSFRKKKWKAACFLRKACTSGCEGPWSYDYGHAWHEHTPGPNYLRAGCRVPGTACFWLLVESDAFILTKKQSKLQNQHSGMLNRFMRDKKWIQGSTVYGGGTRLLLAFGGARIPFKTKRRSYSKKRCQHLGAHLPFFSSKVT